MSAAKGLVFAVGLCWVRRSLLIRACRCKLFQLEAELILSSILTIQAFSYFSLT